MSFIYELSPGVFTWCPLPGDKVNKLSLWSFLFVLPLAVVISTIIGNLLLFRFENIFYIIFSFFSSFLSILLTSLIALMPIYGLWLKKNISRVVDFNTNLIWYQSKKKSYFVKKLSDFSILLETQSFVVTRLSFNKLQQRTVKKTLYLQSGNKLKRAILVQNIVNNTDYSELLKLFVSKGFILEQGLVNINQ